MSAWALVVVPVAGAVAAAAVPRLARPLAAAALALTTMMAAGAAGAETEVVASWGPRLEVTASVTGFARVMVVVVPAVALPIVLYAAATEATARTRLVALLTAFVGAMELLVVAADLLTVLIAWELVGALSWLLIAHDVSDASAGARATHAFVTTRLGDLGLYAAAGIAFAATGSFAFTALSGASGVSLHLIAAGVLVAAAAKSAQVPFAPWLFSAMAGPTPVSALLHSSTMVAAGAYLLVRLAPEFDGVPWFGPALVAVGLAGALAGGVVASVHRHPKRLLAASTTAQYGLMFVAVGAGSAVAAAAQLVAHAAFKSLLFLAAGSAIDAAGSDDLGEMRLGRALPATAALAAVGALALAAVPPLGGAWSKEQVAAIAFERSALLGAAVVAAGTLSAFYILRYWLLAFGPGRPGGAGEERSQVVPLGFLALLSVALGALWLPPVHLAAARLAPGGVVPTHAWEVALGVAGVGLAATVALLLARRGRLAQVAPGAVGRAAAEWFGLPAAARRAVADPTLAGARALAAFDDRVVDAGIRGAGWIAEHLSRLLRRRAEASVDAVVRGVGALALAAAAAARASDDHGVDRAAEGVAGGLGRAGSRLRSLQTGLSHHYYVIVAIGLVALAVTLAAGKS